MSSRNAHGAVTETAQEAAGQRGLERTRREILDAAGRFLWEQPFRELTVAKLMAGTTVGRSSFYVYFTDLYQLAAELLTVIDRELSVATQSLREPDLSPEVIRQDVRQFVDVWARHGPVLRAISEAAAHDESLEQMYRSAFLQGWIDRAQELVVAARAEGLLQSDLPAAELARLIVMMTEGFLCDSLGRPPQADRHVITEVLALGGERILGIDPRLYLAREVDRTSARPV